MPNELSGFSVPGVLDRARNDARAGWAMSALTRSNDVPFGGPQWQADVTQLLDEAHLIAWSDFSHKRAQFAGLLGQFLGNLREVDVCVLYGKHIHDLESLCYQLEHAIPAAMTLERRLQGPSSVASLLRERSGLRGYGAARYRYYLWHDADVLLERDPDLFGRTLDVIAGVGAEAEYSSDDLLLLHRLILVGSSALDVYAQDPRGQCKAWHSSPGNESFWALATGVEAPTFTRFGIDTMSVR